jgi:hypothetical protein
MLYLNRYVNCGNGVIEHTTMRHSNVGNPEDYTYLNVPWGGTRNTVLQDIVVTSDTDGHLVPFTLPSFGSGTARSLKSTLGYTVFAEDLPKSSDIDGQPYPLAANVEPSTLQRNGANCAYETGSNRFRCGLAAQIGSGADTLSPNMGEPGVIVRLTGQDCDGCDCSIIAGVRHWAYSGDATNYNLYFYDGKRSESDLAPELSLAEVQACLPPKSPITVSYSEPPTGKPKEDNLALAHIHGGQDSVDGSSTNGYPRVRYGKADRDFNAYTINTVPLIRGGDTYSYRQYFIMDSYTEMYTRGPEWAPRATEDQYAAGERTGRIVELYSDGSRIFGFTIDNEACSPASGSPTLVCQGRTTPQPLHKALYQIQCGSSFAVSDDLYYFSPMGLPRRSYVCDGGGLAGGTRPVWTLLGFFDATECAAIKSYRYNETYCSS